MRQAATGLCLLILLAAMATETPSIAQPPPNVVIIMADDLGYGDIGAYGAELVSTPYLDTLAEQGVRLTSFYSSANVCTPSRGGLLTGRYPIRLGLTEDVARPSNDIGIQAEEITLAESLKARGYATSIVGKWHLGEDPERSPLKHGFDEFFGLLHSNDMLPLVLLSGETSIEEPVDQTTLTRRYTQEAVAFIERNREQPFFLYFPHTFPHVPLFASPEFTGKSKAGLYGDVVEEIDWSVGRVMEALAKNGLAENTLVIFTSDNGPWWEGSSGSLRDRKGAAWEGGLRVPFLARWPAVLPPGTTSDEPAMNIDLFPTIVAMVGGDLPTDRKVDGRNILPLLRVGAPSPHEALFLFDKSRIAGVRSGRWKLVVESQYRGVLQSFSNLDSYNSPGLLFDLESDPSETYSYTRENPAIVARLTALLKAGQQDLESEVPEAMWFRE